MKIPQVTRYIGDEDEMPIWWADPTSTANPPDLIDFSVIGWTWSSTLTAINDPSTVIFTKTTGFTGDSGTGTQNGGTPNLNIQWSIVGELNVLTDPGTYRFVIVATDSASSQTTMEVHLHMRNR